MANLFEQSDTLCDRANNRCKKRNGCLRYVNTDRDGWESDFFKEFGHFCDGFIPSTKTRISEEKALEHARDIEAEIRKGCKD